jgi:hypothetical protein
METVTKPNAAEDFIGPSAGVVPLSGTKAQANSDVLNRREGSEEVESLEDHPTMSAAVPVELSGAQGSEVNVSDGHLAGVSATQTGDEVE